MSHVLKGSLRVNDLDALAAACEQRGLELVRGQESYKWYEGRSACDHAIVQKNPGSQNYEIGVKAREDGEGYDLLWDPFDRGLERAAGKDMGLLKQEYAAARSMRQLSRQGYRVSRRQDAETGKVFVEASK